MKPRKKWLPLYAAFLSLTAMLIYAMAVYQPLLFIAGDQIFRKDDWERIKPLYFQGRPHTPEEEERLLEQRSLEELVLYKGRQMGVQIDQRFIDEHMKQLGSTKEEREQALRQMNMTEADSVTNIRRALIGFEVKRRVTGEITVTEEEVNSYYRDHLESFRIPELRTIYYVRAGQDDKPWMDKLKTITAERFPSLLKEYGSDLEGRAGFYEWVSQSELSANVGEAAADAVFRSPVKQVVGPVVYEQWTYWFLPVETMPAKTQSLAEVRGKIYRALYLEKESAVYGKWLEEQKRANPYRVFPENLKKNRFWAFWSDLPVRLQLFFQPHA
jgi:parvulin-like peptidyl-prolyl isomerase